MLLRDAGFTKLEIGFRKAFNRMYDDLALIQSQLNSPYCGMTTIALWRCISDLRSVASDIRKQVEDEDVVGSDLGSRCPSCAHVSELSDKVLELSGDMVSSSQKVEDILGKAMDLDACHRKFLKGSTRLRWCSKTCTDGFDGDSRVNILSLNAYTF
ncbi:hypothetical protein BT96DRAFT_990304 [Gymnopus androsaceus JB14]|uniref:Uncharacterized protein n=1 Tax=Gymnopus androsaceus JB14 TaxID=1447944 RepID=A0A6A4HZ04_9AGAR|nr:hypothetical protein BT96DRAFT_990304 [Gymnopus androsaceus JB14]